MEQNGGYFCVDVVIQSRWSKQPFLRDRQHDMSLLHRDFFGFPATTGRVFQTVAYLMFLLYYFRLSEGQSYINDETTLAKRHRCHAVQNAVEWTHTEICQIWG